MTAGWGGPSASRSGKNPLTEGMSPGTKGTTTHQLYATTPETAATLAAAIRAGRTCSPRRTKPGSPDGRPSRRTRGATWLRRRSFPGSPVVRDPFEPDGPPRTLGRSPGGLLDQPGLDGGAVYDRV